eukprot:2393224-Prymnesium_polylepis.1
MSPASHRHITTIHNFHANRGRTVLTDQHASAEAHASDCLRVWRRNRNRRAASDGRPAPARRREAGRLKRIISWSCVARLLG